MHKCSMETPKFPKKKRVLKVLATDVKGNLANVSMNAGSSLLPSEFSNHFSRKSIARDKALSISSYTQLDSTKVLDVEADDLEYKLLYDEYLQAMMTEIIMKKEMEEREKLILTELGAVAKEYDINEEELHKYRRREKDIVCLTRAQNEIDAQISKINESIKNEEIKIIKDILSRLYTLLKPLDKLHCNNIVLPETPEELQNLEQSLKTCTNTLKSIMDVIGSNGNVYKSVHDGIKKFLETYNDIEDHWKKLEIALCNLQILILKTASLSIAQNND